MPAPTAVVIKPKGLNTKRPMIPTRIIPPDTIMNATSLFLFVMGCVF